MTNKLLAVLVIIFALSLFPPDHLEAANKKIAIMQFKANNTAKAHADAVHDILEVNLFKTNVFDIIERDQINVIIKEQGFEGTGCIDTECAVKIGRLLSVDCVMLGSINKIVNYTITIKLIDVAEGTVEYADSEAEITEDKLEEAVNKLALRIAEKNKSGSAMEPPKIVKNDYRERLSYIPAEYYFRGIIPGWAQFYSGRTGKGYLFLGSFILTGSFAIWGYWNYDSKKDAYKDAPISSKKNFDKKFKEYEDATIIGRISLGAFVLCYVANWIDVIFFSKPMEESSMGFYRFDNYYLSFNIINYKFADKNNKLEIKFGIRF